MNIYQEALDVQDACNPSAVALLYSKTWLAFRQMPEYTGTKSVQDNAALRLIAYKLADLHGMRNTIEEWSYTSAYETCKRLAANEPVT